MTLDENFYQENSSEIWIDAYDSGDFPDIEAFEDLSLQFLTKVNDTSTKVNDLISTMCTYTFCGAAISSLVKLEGDIEKPLLSVLVHPFKQSRSPTFSDKETLFAILPSVPNPETEVATVEILNPIEFFEAKKGHQSRKPRKQDNRIEKEK